MERSSVATASVAEPAPAAPVRSREEAEGYVAMVCFKHGPPRLTGVELEWTVHHRADPRQPITTTQLATALGRHAPHTLDPASPASPLPYGSLVTVEPGGQVEISSPPETSLARLLSAASADAVTVGRLLATASLNRGAAALDPHRRPRRLLHTGRYDAMQAFFDPISSYGRQMMCSTAGIQVCLDAGPADARRWQSLHRLGPAIVALFANSSYDAAGDTGWASARMRATLGASPPTTAAPAWCTDPAVDPAAGYARHAVDAPLMCLPHSSTGSWSAPCGVTFADWIDGSRTAAAKLVGRPPTYGDLDYHLTTLFPPVRPHGYFEVRYIDAQPGDDWVAPVALLSTLVADPRQLDRAEAACEPVKDRWLDAARLGLSDPQVARAAEVVADAGCRAIEAAGLEPALTTTITTLVQRRLHDGSPRRCTA